MDKLKKKATLADDFTKQYCTNNIHHTSTQCQINVRKFLLNAGVYPDVLGFELLVMAVEAIKKNAPRTMEQVYQDLQARTGLSAGAINHTTRRIVQMIPDKAYRAVGIQNKPTLKQFLWFFATNGGAQTIRWSGR